MKYLIRIVLIISTVSLSPFTVAADPLPDFIDGETLTAESLNKLIQRSNTHEKTYQIGDEGPAGGIVFYIDGLGHHGLEGAPVDQTSGTFWGCSGMIGTGEGIAAGSANTAAIIACDAASGIAARVADDYALNGFDDWFLPSKDQLNELFLQKDVVGGFPSNPYWSSSETNALEAWLQNFGSGSQSPDFKLNGGIRVRAVRAF